MKKIGLYFGSFNPIHLGHLIVAEYFASHHFDEVWLVVSPQNPLKSSSALAPQHHRLQMVRLAIMGNNNLHANDVEFQLSSPSYTSATLRELASQHPECAFSLILGEDIKSAFHLWKEYLWILEGFPILFFPRHHQAIDPGLIAWNNYRVSTVDCPRIEISSTYLRDLIQRGLSARYLTTDSVLKYIREHSLYQ